MFEYRKLSDLKKLDNNPRKIKSTQFDKLVKSLEENKEYFNARPLILSDRTGELVIIAGNQRHEAAKKLKMVNVPTYLMSGLTEEKEREIIIRDNVNNGDWDHDLLSSLYDDVDLIEWGMEIPIYLDEPEPEEEKETITSYTKLIVMHTDFSELQQKFMELQELGFVCELKE